MIIMVFLMIIYSECTNCDWLIDALNRNNSVVKLFHFTSKLWVIFITKRFNKTLHIENFKFEDEHLIQTHLYNLHHNKPDQSEYISEVGERLLDMCEDIQSYDLGTHKGFNRCVLQFNF
jgi:hypothetical protein